MLGTTRPVGEEGGRAAASGCGHSAESPAFAVSLRWLFMGLTPSSQAYSTIFGISNLTSLKEKRSEF